MEKEDVCSGNKVCTPAHFSRRRATGFDEVAFPTVPAQDRGAGNADDAREVTARRRT